MILFLDKEERRGRGVTLAKQECKLDIRIFSFSQRILNEWNILSADYVCASIVYMFKNNKIDLFLVYAECPSYHDKVS